jgi:hypothetical protein
MQWDMVGDFLISTFMFTYAPVSPFLCSPPQQKYSHLPTFFYLPLKTTLSDFNSSLCHPFLFSHLTRDTKCLTLKFSLNLSQPLLRLLLLLIICSLHMSPLTGSHLHEDNREGNGRRRNGKKNPGQVTMSVLSAS